MNRPVGLAILLALALPLTACPDGYVVNVPLDSVVGDGAGPPSADAFRDRVRVADGFEISLYAAIPKAREVHATEAGDVLVSVPGESGIWRLARDADQDGQPDGVALLIGDLDRPNGIDVHDGWLYVAEGSAIGRIRYDVAAGTTQGAYERVITGLPNGGNHWRRNVRFGPDGLLYLTIGSSCNVCFEEEEWRGKMLRAQPDGSGIEIYARGLRNANDFDWHPRTAALFATDNGRDLLGDDYPPCELNEVVQGGDYGWPVANGDRDPDPDLGEGQEARIAASLPPAFDFPAHNAPLGIHFLEHSPLPDYQHAAIVALHGSWNRSEKDGYKVLSLHWDETGRIEARDFAWGFLEDGDVIGRPVDASEGPDGTIYVSDDYAGAIYRVRASR